MASVIRLWVERGVVKHKAATIAECEMLAMAGATDVLFAYNPVGPNLERIVRLAQMYPQCQFTVTADSDAPMRALSAAAFKGNVTIGVMLDVNVDFYRDHSGDSGHCRALLSLGISSRSAIGRLSCLRWASTTGISC